MVVYINKFIRLLLNAIVYCGIVFWSVSEIDDPGSIHWSALANFDKKQFSSNFLDNCFTAVFKSGHQDNKDKKYEPFDLNVQTLVSQL